MRTVENMEINDGMKLWAYSCRKVGSSYAAIKPYLDNRRRILVT